MSKDQLKVFDESYKWWGDFLAARREAIHAMKRLGKSFEEIQYTLGMNFPQHAECIWNGTKSIHEELENDISYN